MHELSIALNIVDVAAAEVKRHPEAAVSAVHVRLGPLSGIVKEALLSAFEIAREASPLAHAELVIEEIPIRFYCQQCEMEVSVASIQALVCPTCSSPAGEVLSGRELEVSALEIEA